MNYCFPFGQELKTVKQEDIKPKKIFVLGKYASAVHAKWFSKDNEIKSQALAVSSEPYIFWRGENADQIISEIHIPKEAGFLLSADKRFNGPSGRALDEHYLLPLGYNREDAWLCDLVPYSCQNYKQKYSLEQSYNQLIKDNILPKYQMPKVPNGISDERRKEILSELFTSKAEKIILLGDDPIKWFLNHISDCKMRSLRDFGDSLTSYGNEIEVKIAGNYFTVLPLVHPRQFAKLGTYIEKWYNLHLNWKIQAGKSDILH